MRSADEQRALVALITEVLAFYGQETSRFALQVWLQACDGRSVEEVRKALGRHATDPERGVFAPKPADLVRELAGTQTDRALLAWGKVHEAMQRVGAYTSVVFDDGAIHAAIEDIGGWPSICRSSIEELPHLQRRFCASYKAYAGRPDLPYPPRLMGEHEAINRHTGKLLAAPAYVGDAQRAAEVERLGSSRSRVAITTAVQTIPLRLAQPDDARAAA